MIPGQFETADARAGTATARDDRESREILRRAGGSWIAGQGERSHPRDAAPLYDGPLPMAGDASSMAHGEPATGQAAAGKSVTEFIQHVWGSIVSGQLQLTWTISRLAPPPARRLRTSSREP